MDAAERCSLAIPALIIRRGDTVQIVAIYRQTSHSLQVQGVCTSASFSNEHARVYPSFPFHPTKIRPA
jgi:hypothetical protein